MKYFSKSEFECKCGCGTNNVKTEVKDKLDKARELARVPFTITSGSRCSAHNKSVGGKESSSHVTGYAVDIKATTSRHRFLINKALMDVGFTRIGIDKEFIHCDIDPNKSPRVTWVY